jgi:hypothetical protein
MAGPWEQFQQPAGPWAEFSHPGVTVPGPRQAKDLGDAIIAGVQNSATGLAVRGKLPSQQLGEDAPWYHRLAAGGAGIAVDLPLSIAGAIAGAAGGGAAGTAVAPGPGTAAGVVVGGGAGAFAAPMALREALIEAYNHNHAMSWSGAWDIAVAGLKGGTKGAIIGGATAGAGRIVAPLVTKAGGGATATTVAATGAELATLTATSAALEGHMPTWQDFMDNALLLGGMKGAVHVAGKLRGIYAETGKTPAEVLRDAEIDPALKASLNEKTAELPPQYGPAALEQRIVNAIEADPRPEMIRKNLAGTTEPPKLGDPSIADPVKYEYISDRDTAKGVLRAVTDMYQTEITAQTRGVVTNKATAVEAIKMISDGVIGEHAVGAAGNAAEIYARAHMLRGATNHAVTELGKIAGLPDAELTPAAKLQALAALERVAMLKAEIEGVGAEAGRALQIFRAMKRDPSFLGEAETLLKLAERKGRLQDVAAMALRMKDPAQMAEFARLYTKATTTEKMLEAFKAGLVSGPQTHLANIAGNLMKWGVELPESVIAASLTAAGKQIKGDPLTMAQWKARAFGPIYGLQFGAKESLHVAAEVWRGHGEHLEKADVYRTAIEGKTGEVVRIPFKVLQVEDALFRTVAERGKAYEMAVDRAVKEGLHPETLEGREKIVQYTQRPEFGLSEKDGLAAINKVQEAGAESVFSQRLGPRMEMAQRAIAGTPFGFVVPFVRTPANLVSWAIQHTPGLNLMSGRWREDFAAGGERQARAIARVTIGTGLAMTAYSFAQDGLITGGGMFDKEQGRTKRAAGWQPYSVKIGDKYYSYQRIEPVAKVIGLAADLFELATKADKEEDKLKIAGMLVLMFGNATVSTTYLSGLSNAIQSISDPTRYGENFLEQYATATVPKIVGQSVTMADPYKREVDGVMDAIQSQLPFLREKLLPKRDAWGEPMQNDRWFAVMPVATSQISEDKVKTEAVRLAVAIADAPKYLMEKGPFNPKDKRVKLEPEQRDVFREVAGKSAMAILAPIVSAPDWERIPDFAKSEIYKHVLEGTRKQGAYAALPTDAVERVKLREKIVQQIIKQTTEAQGK